MKIKHVRQESKSGCVIACAAMVAGITYKEALKHTKDREDGLCSTEELALLKKLGVQVVIQRTTEFKYNYVYVVTVPSVNIPKANHRIVVDTRPEPFEDWLVYDPNVGNDGKLLYGPNWDLRGWGQLWRVK